jgi:hypothetical protein
MKMQIDTTAKTIKIEGAVKLSVLFDHLQKFFPGGEWEDYDLQTNTVINNWASPIIINKPYPYQWTGSLFYVGGATTITGTTISQSASCGTYVLDSKSNGTITNCGTSAGVHSSVTYGRA